MTGLEIATLACKVLALWMFAQVALSGMDAILMTIIALGSGEFQWTRVTVVGISASAVAKIAAGLFFWFRAKWLAARMVSTEPTPITGGSTQENWMAVAFSAVGVFVLVHVLQDMAASIVGAICGSEWKTSAYWQADLSASIMGLAFAIWLIVGSRGIVKFVMWARTAAERRQG